MELRGENSNTNLLLNLKHLFSSKTINVEKFSTLNNFNVKQKEKEKNTPYSQKKTGQEITLMLIDIM